MIAQVSGEVRHVGLDRVVVVVGGVGLLVHTTPSTAAACRVGSAVDLATTLIVREESLTLFGFAEVDARDLFETLQTVSGVGPRLALAMVSVLSPDQVRAAISTGDLATLCKIPGVGKKSAERLVLELRDKIGMPSAAPATHNAPAAAVAAPWKEQVGEALVGLGWSAKQASDAVERITPAADVPIDIAALLRAALQELRR